MKRAKQKSITLKMTLRQFDHLVAALEFLSREWDSHGAYDVLRRQVGVETGPYMLRGEFESFIDDVKAHREVVR